MRALEREAQPPRAQPHINEAPSRQSSSHEPYGGSHSKQIVCLLKTTCLVIGLGVLAVPSPAGYAWRVDWASGWPMLLVDAGKGPCLCRAANRRLGSARLTGSSLSSQRARVACTDEAPERDRWRRGHLRKPRRSTLPNAVGECSWRLRLPSRDAHCRPARTAGMQRVAFRSEARRSARAHHVCTGTSASRAVGLSSGSGRRCSSRSASSPVVRPTLAPLRVRGRRRASATSVRMPVGRVARQQRRASSPAGVLQKLCGRRQSKLE